jgi:hypothetical protein
MHPMSPRARVDLATRSQKRQVHWKNRQRMVNDAATLENFNRGILTPGCRIGRLPCRAFDFLQRARVFQRRRIAEFFAETSGSNDASRDFGISRFGNVADEQNFLGSERFAKLGGERVF